MTINLPKPVTARQQLTLLDTTIVILISCSIIIFVFTIGAKFLGQDTFDRLPDFLKDSYSALWSAGTVAGGALVASIIDALSKNPSTKTGFIAYIMVTTLLIMTLIVGTVMLSKLTQDPQFGVPNGATSVNVAGNTSKPVEFYLQNRLPGGNQATIVGHYEIKDGQLNGEVEEAQLLPAIGVPPPPLPLTSISVHLCYLAIQNGNPISARRPDIAVPSNRKDISAAMDLREPYRIEGFKFKIEVSDLNNITPAYLCAFIGGPQSMPMIYF